MAVAQNASSAEAAVYNAALYLRIQQLQKGLLQFTDSTNAYRLVREFGKDIRYIAPWKKWIVWTGAYWEVDSGGALIHTKGLEMVRNIYGELYKTTDYPLCYNTGNGAGEEAFGTPYKTGNR